MPTAPSAMVLMSWAQQPARPSSTGFTNRAIMPTSAFEVLSAMACRKHHWWFGDMPPVAGITDQQVEQLICYIRELQLANGIFEDGAYSFTC